MVTLPSGNPATPPPPVGGPPGAANPNQLTVAKLDAWQLPTMMITGDADLYTPAPIMHIFVSHLKHGEGVVVHQAAQAPYWENPEEYDRAVLTFIRKH
jgi:pimeloyl-ACP methyl ester carboxylesterase